ncbi:Glu/Leu/Phe/Val family dehydrogenase [Geopsychrobacter electrodiphilus]|uniref:Glu/Leu/Phe/Val family dehydrogenase n=1 Tax=Geopsychrobacter electrodiphilus TaxID=225196 RepID=UPI000367CD56|nr:Glu/Leu/Phe/Val dehydrogenase [Geopsychrobacter electrodiphilus]
MNTIEFDDLGPARLVQLYDPQTGLRAMVVVDNIALGIAIGGVRISPSVSLQEVARLARTMTMKSAIAGLDHGGGKAGIIADPKQQNIEQLVRAFARMMQGVEDYVPAPDMGSDERMMVWIKEEIGRVLGLPEEIGGLPLDKLGATGYGLAECAEIACQHLKTPLQNARVAIQGFGSVGRAAARFLVEKGAIIVAVSDTSGTLTDPQGLEIDKLIAHKLTNEEIRDAGQGEYLVRDAVFASDCDILIPAATPDVINASNMHQVKARLILEGANIPITREAEDTLTRKGVRIVPDFIANAGGLIMAAMEYRQKSAEEAFVAITRKIQKNTEQILRKAQKEDILPRAAAEQLALERVKAAMTVRNLSYPWK